MGVKESALVFQTGEFYGGHHSETLLKNAMNTVSKHKNPP